MKNNHFHMKNNNFPMKKNHFHICPSLFWHRLSYLNGSVARSAQAAGRHGAARRAGRPPRGLGGRAAEGRAGRWPVAEVKNGQWPNEI